MHGEGVHLSINSLVYSYRFTEFLSVQSLEESFIKDSNILSLLESLINRRKYSHLLIVLPLDFQLKPFCVFTHRSGTVFYLRFYLQDGFYERE